MDTYLFLDTETTGLKKSGSLMQSGQGRVCQVAMILADQTGRTLAEYQSMVKLGDWDLEGKTENYYGLSYDDCERYGVHQYKMMEMYYALSANALQIVAHNADFDKGMMDIEAAYHNDVMTASEAISRTTPWYCTMKNNTHISHNGKWPKLDYALKHYTGRDLINAHDAMADTRACRDIFFAMRGIQLAA